MSTKKSKKSKIILFVIFLILISLLYFYLLYSIKVQPKLDTKKITVEDILVSQIQIKERAFYGSKNASITFVLFSNFDCDSCNNYYEEIYPVLKEEYIETGKIRYYHKFFLLDEDIGTENEQINLAKENYCLQKTNANYWQVYPNKEQTKPLQNCLGDLREVIRDSFEIDLYGISGQPTMFIGVEGRENTIITGNPTLTGLRRVIKEKEILLGIE